MENLHRDTSALGLKDWVYYNSIRSIQTYRHLVELQIFLRFKFFNTSTNGIFWQKTDPKEQR